MSLTNVVEGFIRGIDDSVKVVWHDGAMESSILDNTLYLNVEDFLYEVANEDVMFSVLKELGYIFDVSMPTFMVLHELGHILSRSAIKGDVSEHLALYELSVSHISTLKEPLRMRTYYRLYLERLANEKANEIYMHAYPRVKALDYLIKEAAQCMLLN